MNPPTCVITLKSQPDRWTRCFTHLNGRGYWAQPWAGIDAEKMGLVTTNSHRVPDGRDYTPPPYHVGCCLSHWLLWRDLWRNWGGSSNPVAVMEDDVELREDWEPMLYAALKDLPDDWDILFAGSCNAKFNGATHYKGNLWQAKEPLCTHFYLVRPKALPVLIESCERIYTNIDWAIIEQAIPHLNTYAVLPRLAHQHGMEDLPE